MSRVCAVTGKKPTTGNNVSHSNRKTRRTWAINLQNVSMPSEVLGRTVTLRTTASGIRTIEHNGGIDAYVLNTPSSKLSAECKALKKQMQAKQAAKAA